MHLFAGAAMITVGAAVAAPNVQISVGLAMLAWGIVAMTYAMLKP